ncbi:hypothetical protein IFR05_017260, partial [Cadophora sp. M221]
MPTTTPSLSSPPNPNPDSNPNPKPTHLIIVCCHAIYTGSSSPSTAFPSDPSNWLLAPFQTGEIPTFTAHMQAGLSLLASSGITSENGGESNDALLVFSGSKTRPEIDKSEARGYLDFCIRNEFWGILKPVSDGNQTSQSSESKLDQNQNQNPTPILNPDPPHPGGDIKDSTPAVKAEGEPIQYHHQSSIHLDNQALDSYHNILFPLLLFHTHTHTWPSLLTIITHAFKRPRFMTLHIPALRYPAHRVRFVGIDPEYMREGDEMFDE